MTDVSADALEGLDPDAVRAALSLLVRQEVPDFVRERGRNWLSWFRWWCGCRGLDAVTIGGSAAEWLPCRHLALGQGSVALRWGDDVLAGASPGRTECAILVVRR